MLLNRRRDLEWLLSSWLDDDSDFEFSTDTVAGPYSHTYAERVVIGSTIACYQYWWRLLKEQAVGAKTAWVCSGMGVMMTDQPGRRRCR